jgi:hypothetical protein
MNHKNSPHLQPAFDFDCQLYHYGKGNHNNFQEFSLSFPELKRSLRFFTLGDTG